MTGRLFSFLLRVARGFMRNQGLLLSGAVAYYTLLSIVPLSIMVVAVILLLGAQVIAELEHKPDEQTLFTRL